MAERQPGDLPCPITGEGHAVESWVGGNGIDTVWRNRCSACGDDWVTGGHPAQFDGPGEA